MVPLDHPQATRGPVHIREVADETWAEDNDGSAALPRQHAARAGVIARIDLSAVDLSGTIALVATGHAVALVPGVLVSALRSDVTSATLVDPPTRGIYALSARRGAVRCGATRTRPPGSSPASSRRPSARASPTEPPARRSRAGEHSTRSAPGARPSRVDVKIVKRDLTITEHHARQTG